MPGILLNVVINKRVCNIIVHKVDTVYCSFSINNRLQHIVLVHTYEQQSCIKEYKIWF